MESAQNQTFNGTTVVLDDKHFLNCRFEKCLLVYGGGDFAWNNCQFADCSISLIGAADRTAKFLGHWGILKQGEPLTPSAPPSQTIN